MPEGESDTKPPEYVPPGDERGEECEVCSTVENPVRVLVLHEMPSCSRRGCPYRTIPDKGQKAESD